MKVYLNADFALIELFNKIVERFFNSLFGYANSRINARSHSDKKEAGEHVVPLI